MSGLRRYRWLAGSAAVVVLVPVVLWVLLEWWYVPDTGEISNRDGRIPDNQGSELSQEPSNPFPTVPVEAQAAGPQHWTGFQEAGMAAPAAAHTPPTPIATQPVVTPDPTLEPVIVAIIENVVNLRDGPGTAFDVIGTVHKGDELTITGMTKEGDWLHIRQGVRSGWVYTSLTDALMDTVHRVAQAFLEHPLDHAHVALTDNSGLWAWNWMDEPPCLEALEAWARKWGLPEVSVEFVDTASADTPEFFVFGVYPEEGEDAAVVGASCQGTDAGWFGRPGLACQTGVVSGTQPEHVAMAAAAALYQAWAVTLGTQNLAQLEGTGAWGWGALVPVAIPDAGGGRNAACSLPALEGNVQP